MNFLEKTVVSDYSSFKEVGEKSGEAVTKTLSGYERLRESEKDLEVLKSLIEKFEV